MHMFNGAARVFSGDVNQIANPKLHAQVFDYLVRLTDTLIKIKQNQGVSCNNQNTPQAPELVPPLTLILPWCFGALELPDAYEEGKLSAVRLLCTVMLNSDAKHLSCLPHFYRSLHLGEYRKWIELQTKLEFSF